MLQLYGLLSKIGAVVSGRSHRAPRVRTHRKTQGKAAGQGERTCLAEHEDYENDLPDKGTMRKVGTLHHDDHTVATSEDVPPWFGWFP